MNYDELWFVHVYSVKESPFEKQSYVRAVQVPTNGTTLWMPKKWQDQWWYMVVEPSIVLVMKQQKLGYHNIS
jgi:hypothetical protein